MVNSNAHVVDHLPSCQSDVACRDVDFQLYTLANTHFYHKAVSVIAFINLRLLHTHFIVVTAVWLLKSIVLPFPDIYRWY